MSASQDARQILLELSMLAGGSTQNLNASRGGGEALGPSGDGRAGRESHHGNLFVFWSQAFASAGWDVLPGLVEQAREDLEGFKRRTAPLDAGQDPEKERREQMLEDGAGLPVEHIATAYGYSVSLVRKYRRDAQLHPETGLSTKSAVELQRQGKSKREIARLTGIPLTTVHRSLGKDAA